MVIFVIKLGHLLRAALMPNLLHSLTVLYCHLHPSSAHPNPPQSHIQIYA